MNTVLLDKILSIIIVIGIIIILAFLILILRININIDENEVINYSNKDINIDDENVSMVNNYEEITVAYSILYKYFTYLYEGDYDKFTELYKNSKTISKDNFDKLYNLTDKENKNYNYIVNYQGKIDNDTYIIKYYLDELKECTMVYTVDTDNYLFSIEQDSNFGDE